MPVTAPKSSAVVPAGQTSLFGKVTAPVFLFAHNKYPFSGEFVATYLLTAIAEPLKKKAPTIRPITNFPEPEIFIFISYP